MKFLPTKIHGALDYAVAAALIVAPFMFDFISDSEFSHWLSFGAGIGLFFYSLGTDYEAGVRNALSIRQHLVLDGAAGALFVLLAFVGAFKTVTSVFYFIVGAAVLAVVAVTELPDREEQAAAEARKAARAERLEKAAQGRI